MADKTPEEIEIETLRNHNAELLADLKKSRKKVSELTADIESVTKERDQKEAELVEINLNQPVQHMLERISTMPEYFLAEFNLKGYKFVRENGEIVVRDNDDRPIEFIDMHKKKREVKFTEDDIKRLSLEEWLPKSERSKHVPNFEKLVIYSRASGGGAVASSSSGGSTEPKKTEEKPTLSTSLI